MLAIRLFIVSIVVLGCSGAPSQSATNSQKLEGSQDDRLQGEVSESATPDVATLDEQVFVDVESLARFATDDFAAACLVVPQRIVTHDSLSLLPIWRRLPKPITLSRFEETGIRGLALYCRPRSAALHSATSDLEWAAAVRTEAPFEIARVAEKWKRSVVPYVRPSIEPRPIEIGSFSCFEVPGGTFFEKRCILGEPSFTNRDGERVDDGIRVGFIDESREYIEGDTRASAIFTFSNVEEAALQDEQLLIRVTGDVFRTAYVGDTPALATVQLRHPSSGVSSEAIPLQVRSFVETSIRIPRSLRSDDGRELQLLRDLVDDGRVEVILTHRGRGSYLGFSTEGVAIVPPASEYVWIAGNEAIITESVETMKQMLDPDRSRSELETRLRELASADMRVAVSIATNAQRVACRRLAERICDAATSSAWGESLQEGTARFSLDRPESATITARFESRRTARQVARDLNESRDTMRSGVRKRVKEAFGRFDARCNLLGLAVALRHVPCPNFLIARNDPDGEQRTKEVSQFIENALDGFEFQVEDETVSIRYGQPARVERPAPRTRANLRLILATDLHNYDRFDMGEEMLKKATSHASGLPQVWMLRTWEMSYNVAARFDGPSDRYPWIRRGMMGLIDGARQQPDELDLVWFLAYVLDGRIGRSQGQAVLRKLFAEDDELHARLSELVDISSTRSPVHRVEALLVAKALWTMFIERLQDDACVTSVRRNRVDVMIPRVDVHYAEAMTEAGEWNVARQHWREASAALRRIAARRKALKQEEQAESPSTSAWEFILESISRCEFELSDQVEAARRSFHEARAANDQGVPEKELADLVEGFRHLATFAEENRERMQQFASIFATEADRCRELQSKLGDDDATLSPILDLCLEKPQR